MLGVSFSALLKYSAAALPASLFTADKQKLTQMLETCFFIQADLPQEALIFMILDQDDAPEA